MKVVIYFLRVCLFSWANIPLPTPLKWLISTKLFLCFVVKEELIKSTWIPFVYLHNMIQNFCQINVIPVLQDHIPHGAKKIIFTACHSGKLKLAFTSPGIISTTSPKSFLTSRIDFTVLLLFELLKQHHLPIGQVKNRIHQPHSKIH